MMHFFWTPVAQETFNYGIYDIANTEIAKYAAYHLGSRTAFSLHSFLASRVTTDPNDILLGHPTFHHPSLGWIEGDTANWMADNALDARDRAHPNSYIMMPWISTSAWDPKRMPYLAQQLADARLIFAMCGEYWYDRTMALTDDSLASSVKDKLVRINVGCEVRTLPMRWSPRPGPRKTFLHVSNLDPYKRFDLLLDSIAGTDAHLVVASAAMAKGVVNFQRDNGTVGRFTSLGPFFNASDDFNRYVAEECDFYIHTSDGDAQATAILENCARGLVPLVTPESGFSCDYALPLSLDPVANRAVIEAAMTMSDADYHVRSIGARRHVEQHHAWSAIYDTVWRAIERTRR